MELLRRWTEHLRRFSPGPAGSRAADLAWLTEEVEAGLREIDFDGVTTEDRITFVEYAVAWQVRRALRCGRFDLALQLQRFGADRTAQLYERTHGGRPALLYGAPSTPEREAESRR
jgi:hypothetical protein